MILGQTRQMDGERKPRIPIPRYRGGGAPQKRKRDRKNRLGKPGAHLGG